MKPLVVIKFQKSHKSIGNKIHLKKEGAKLL